MPLEVGRYKTAAGSRVHVRTRNAGSWTADFDKFEEPHACLDCRVVDVDPHEQSLVWECNHCDGGMAKLTFVSAT